MAGRPESIAVDQLSSAVQAAVREVSGKHGLRIGDNLVFKPSILIGRQLMEAVSNIDAAQKMAADLAGHLQRSGIGGGAQLSPGVLVQGGHIILGYFPMDQVFEVPGAGG